MNHSPEDIEATLQRHTREIVELREELRTLKESQSRKDVQAHVERRIAEIEAEIRLHELQEEIAREQGGKRKRRRFLLFG